MPFGNAILVMGTDTTKRKSLVRCLTMFCESIVRETTVVSTVILYHYPMTSGNSLESQFRLDGLVGTEARHIMHIDEVGVVIDEDGGTNKSVCDFIS